MTRQNKQYLIGRALFLARQKYADHKYLDNILKRVRFDFEYRYVRIKYKNKIVCAYCGQKSTGFDHHPPISKYETYLSACEKADRKPDPIKISCCGECNRLLGPTLSTNFYQRLLTLRKRLRKKYKHLGPRHGIEYAVLKQRLNFERGLNRLKGKGV